MDDDAITFTSYFLAKISGPHFGVEMVSVMNANVIVQRSEPACSLAAALYRTPHRNFHIMQVCTLNNTFGSLFVIAIVTLMNLTSIAN